MVYGSQAHCPLRPVRNVVWRVLALSTRNLGPPPLDNSPSPRPASKSHELRCPVASIRQHAEVALAHPDPTTIPDLADTVSQRPCASSTSLRTCCCWPAPTNRRSLSNGRRWILTTSCSSRLPACAPPPPLRIATAAVSAGRVWGDPPQLQRLVANLADNAARHATARVAFTLTDADDTVVLRVDDDGDDGGAGLGLPIVASIAAAHGATVTASSNQFGGARLEVRLPAQAERPRKTALLK